MSSRKKTIVLTPPERKGKPIKLRLDARTVVMVKNAKALAFWKQRYPKAEIIEDQGSAKVSAETKRSIKAVHKVGAKQLH